MKILNKKKVKRAFKDPVLEGLDQELDDQFRIMQENLLNNILKVVKTDLIKAKKGGGSRKGRGGQRPNHKYIRREGTPGHYQYWYRDAAGHEYVGNNAPANHEDHDPTIPPHKPKKVLVAKQFNPTNPVSIAKRSAEPKEASSKVLFQNNTHKIMLSSDHDAKVPDQHKILDPEALHTDPTHTPNSKDFNHRLNDQQTTLHLIDKKTNRVIGHLAMETTGDTHSHQIRSIHIDKAAQGKGNAKKLYEAALNYATRMGEYLTSDDPEAQEPATKHIWEQLRKRKDIVSRKNPDGTISAKKQLKAITVSKYDNSDPRSQRGQREIDFYNNATISNVAYKPPKGANSNVVGQTRFGDCVSEVEAEFHKFLGIIDSVLSLNKIKFKTPINFSAKGIVKSPGEVNGLYQPLTNQSKNKWSHLIRILDQSESGKTLWHEVMHGLDCSMAEYNPDKIQVGRAESVYLTTNQKLKDLYQELEKTVVNSKFFKRKRSEAGYRRYIGAKEEVFARAGEVWGFAKTYEAMQQGKIPRSEGEEFLRKCHPDLYKTTEIVNPMGDYKETAEYKQYMQEHENINRQIVSLAQRGVTLDSSEVKKLRQQQQDIQDTMASRIQRFEVYRPIPLIEEAEVTNKVVSLMDQILAIDKIKKSLSEIK